MFSKSFHLLVVFGLVISIAAAAGTPIATVMSGKGLVLSGTQIPATGASFWPLVSGDEVETTQSSAVIMFQDQSRVTLEKNSKIKLERQGNTTQLHLLQGAAQLKAVAGARLKIYALGRLIKLETPFEGIISLEGPGKVQVKIAHGNVQVDENSPNDTSTTTGSTTSAPGMATLLPGMRPVVVAVTFGAIAATAVGVAITRESEPARSPSRP